MKKIALIILDGFGLSRRKKGNAIYLAKTPFIDSCLKRKHAVLKTDGSAVGLDDGVFGNSEVGHLNIGCGRPILQSIAQINNQIKSGEFYKNKQLINAFNAKRVHLIGLVSDGKVHADLQHIISLIKMAKEQKVSQLFLHVITDGRDSDVHQAYDFVNVLKDIMQKEGIGEFATISGRFYAMDRENNLDRTEKYFNVLTNPIKNNNDILKVIKESYEKDVTDEFIIPTPLKVGAEICSGDSVILFNFRADRMRQLCALFLKKTKDIKLTSFTRYSKKFNNISVAFEKDNVDLCLGQILADYDFKQLRVAETTKFAHVTYFFNGEIEKPFKNEKRIIIEGESVEDFSKTPQMKAKEIANTVINETSKVKYNFVLVNFANCDMVGHTGNLQATIKAVEIIDENLKRLSENLMQKGYDIIITADHGNADYMIDKNGNKVTTHSMAPAPFILLSKNKYKIKRKGKLSNVSPTILHYFGIKIPKNFENSLFLTK